MIKNNHCTGFILSFKNIMAKIAANIGAKYRKETAVPTAKYLTDIKNKVIEVTPTNPLNINNLLLLPITRILFLKRNPNVKTKELADLKKTIWNALILSKYFTVIFIQANAKVLININFIAFFICTSLIL